MRTSDPRPRQCESCGDYTRRQRKLCARCAGKPHPPGWAATLAPGDTTPAQRLDWRRLLNHADLAGVPVYRPGPDGQMIRVTTERNQP